MLEPCACRYHSRRDLIRDTSASASAANPFVANVARSVLPRICISHTVAINKQEGDGQHSQSKDLGLVSRLNVVSFALPRIACYYTEVLACNCHDGPTVVRVRIERVRRHSMAVWHSGHAGGEGRRQRDDHVEPSPRGEEGSAVVITRRSVCCARMAGVHVRVPIVACMETQQPNHALSHDAVATGQASTRLSGLQPHSVPAGLAGLRRAGAAVLLILSAVI